MSKDLNNSNKNSKGPLREFLTKSNAREGRIVDSSNSEKAMKAPIKKSTIHADDVYVWQEGDGSKDVGWDANGSPSVAYDKDSIKGVSRQDNKADSRTNKPLLHDWSDNILHLTCTYCEQNPCECDGKGHDF